MNNMEIKQGDKVRVSKDAPKLIFGGCDMSQIVCTVCCVDKDVAAINMINDERTEMKVWIIPTKYLVKVDAEEKEANVKIGDKVIVHYPSGDRIGRIQEEMSDGTYDIDYGDGCTGHNITRSQIEPYTAPKFKVGDRVRNIESGLIGVVDKIVYGNIAWVNGVDGKRYHWKSDGLELIEPTEQTHQRATIISEGDIHSLDETSTNKIGSISIPVEVDLTNSYWDAYASELAKEVALKVANKFNAPHEAAEYAVSVAKAVVEGLKRK